MRQGLIDEIMSLDSDDKRTLVGLLLRDPELAPFAFDPMGLRTNYEAARILQKMIDKKKVAREPKSE